MTLNDLITERQSIKDQLAELAHAESALKQILGDLDLKLLALLDEQGTTATRVDTADARISVSISEEIVPNAQDWSAIYDFVQSHNAFQLLQRRLSSAAYRELQGLYGENIPGIEPFTKRSINMRRTAR